MAASKLPRCVARARRLYCYNYDYYDIKVCIKKKFYNNNDNNDVCIYIMGNIIVIYVFIE